MNDSLVDLSDGRKLAYIDVGEPEWPCLLFFHGAPSSRLRLAYLEREFLDHGVRLVSPDRPGYGRSSAQPGRAMDDWPADVAALADALGVDRFLVAGHSSGGPYAVACAARLRDRVQACMTIGGVTDMAWPGAWEDYLELEAQLMRIPDEQAAIEWCVERLGPDGSGFMAASDMEFPEPDARLYENEQIAPLLALARTEAFRQGVAGYAQDIHVQGRPWPFDPGSIAAPVSVLHGELDNIVPLAHSSHTAEVIPGAVLQVLAGHGHLSILGELPNAAAALAGTRG
jgi:pimeloyl-ACP methyl ester carboxylesterase